MTQRSKQGLAIDVVQLEILASQRRAPARAIDEENSDEVVWGACVIDEVQDVDVAGRARDERETQEILNVIRNEKVRDKNESAFKDIPSSKLASNPTWRKKIPGEN